MDNKKNIIQDSSVCKGARGKKIWALVVALALVLGSKVFYATYHGDLRGTNFLVKAESIADLLDSLYEIFYEDSNCKKCSRNQDITQAHIASLRHLCERCFRSCVRAGVRENEDTLSLKILIKNKVGKLSTFSVVSQQRAIRKYGSGILKNLQEYMKKYPTVNFNKRFNVSLPAQRDYLYQNRQVDNQKRNQNSAITTSTQKTEKDVRQEKKKKNVGLIQRSTQNVLPKCIKTSTYSRIPKKTTKFSKKRNYNSGSPVFVAHYSKNYKIKSRKKLNLFAIGKRFEKIVRGKDEGGFIIPKGGSIMEKRRAKRLLRSMQINKQILKKEPCKN